jgi:hypothetical protein
LSEAETFTKLSASVVNVRGAMSLVLVEVVATAFVGSRKTMIRVKTFKSKNMIVKSMRPRGISWLLLLV